MRIWRGDIFDAQTERVIPRTKITIHTTITDEPYRYGFLDDPVFRPAPRKTLLGDIAERLAKELRDRPRPPVPHPVSPEQLDRLKASLRRTTDVFAELARNLSEMRFPHIHREDPMKDQTPEPIEEDTHTLGTHRAEAMKEAGFREATADEAEAFRTSRLPKVPEPSDDETVVDDDTDDEEDAGGSNDAPEDARVVAIQRAIARREKALNYSMNFGSAKNAGEHIDALLELELDLVQRRKEIDGARRTPSPPVQFVQMGSFSVVNESIERQLLAEVRAAADVPPGPTWAEMMNHLRATRISNGHLARNAGAMGRVGVEVGMHEIPSADALVARVIEVAAQARTLQRIAAMFNHDPNEAAELEQLFREFRDRKTRARNAALEELHEEVRVAVGAPPGSDWPAILAKAIESASTAYASARQIRSLEDAVESLNTDLAAFGGPIGGVAPLIPSEVLAGFDTQRRLPILELHDSKRWVRVVLTVDCARHLSHLLNLAAQTGETTNRHLEPLASTTKESTDV